VTRAVIIFIAVIIINTIICAIFLFIGLAQQANDDSKEKQTLTDMNGYYLQVFVMFFCPVVGPVFIIIAHLIYASFLRGGVDLEDVIFGKDKIKAPRKAEEEIERNRVPLEEALAVSDKQSLRGLMLDVVRGNVQKSLSSINLALNSEDSETSHYAATVMRDSLNDFRQRTLELYNTFKEDYVQPEEYACMLIEYMNEILPQDLFPEMEQREYVDKMEEACYFLYKDDEYKEKLSCEYIEWLAVLLLKLKEYDRVERWSEISTELYPAELSTYTIRLKLAFSRGDRDLFFRVMNELKKADVVIDKETLELIRIFS